MTSPVNANWKRIWERKGENVPNDLAEAILVNGFDTAGGKLDMADFERLVDRIRSELAITNESRVLDVGCGCGTILQALSPGVGVGIDYSSTLVDAARQVYPEAIFEHAEANRFEAAEETFDAVYSHGIFMYLPDLDYLRETLRRMVEALRPGGRGLLLDIPDAATEEACESYRSETIPDYDEKYATTPHRYWRKEDLLAVLESLGCQVWSTPSFTRDYGYRRFRFNFGFERRSGRVRTHCSRIK